MRTYIVRCPACGKYRRTSSTSSVRCFFCGKSFKALEHATNESVYRKDTNKNVGFN